MYETTFDTLSGGDSASSVFIASTSLSVIPSLAFIVFI